jgi:hypothetical protein
MLKQFIYELLSVVLAFAVGIKSYRYFSKNHKILFWQLVSWLVIYLIAYGITKYQKYHDIPRNNHWIFNINILIECTFLFVAAYATRAAVRFRLTFAALYILFVIVYVLLMMVMGIQTFNIYAFLAESVTISLMYILLLYTFFHHHRSSTRPVADIVMCSGITLYFLCIVPYISMMDYLNKHHLATSKLLFSLITDGLANLRYLLLAAGFFLIYKKLDVRPTHD